MSTPTPLPTVRRPGAAGGSGAALVFVHGAWHGPWCWESWSAGAREDGFATAIPTLPGHDRPGTSGRIWPRMSRYVAHVRELVEAIDGPVVIVGHSMGGYITQRLLEAPPANVAGAVLVASVPRRGVAGATVRLLRRSPGATLRALLTADLLRVVATPERARQAFFTPDTPEAVVTATHERLQNESYLAFVPMLARFSRPTGSLPMLVVGAEDDGVFSLRSQRRLAAAHTASLEVVRGGHDVMLDVNSAEALRVVLDWSRRILER